LHEDNSRKTECEIFPEWILHRSGDDISTIRDRKKERNQTQCTDKPKLLYDHRKNKISLNLGKISKFLDRFTESEPSKTTTPYGDESLFDLVIFSIDIFFRKKSLVILKETIDTG
jgi:hypothetical protein